MMKRKPPSFFFSCEHAGNEVPSEFKRLFKGKSKLLSSHRGFDIGIFPVAQQISAAMDVPLVAHPATRLLVEVNRSRRHPSLFSDITKPLSRELKHSIIRDFYLPHRNRVEQMLNRMITVSGSVIHIGFHSFTPVLNGQVRNVDIGLLYDPRRAREKRFCQTLRASLQAEHPDLRIRMNAPYRGAADGLTTSLRKRRPDTKYLGVEIEVNQRLLATAPARCTMASILTRSLQSVQEFL